MTPVQQDKFNHTFKYGGGNCLQAAVASLFDLPIEAVPHFMLFGDALYWDALCLYIKSLGFELLGFVSEVPPFDDKYYLCSLDNGTNGHAVIMKNGIIVHDPHPNKDLNGWWVAGYYKIVLKNNCPLSRF